MKKRNRMLAILLAFTMVLTFIPMLAFAEGEEADAEPQVTEETAEEVEEEAAVEAEVGAHEAEASLAAESSEEAVPTSFTFKPANGFKFEAEEGDDWLSTIYPGNEFVVGYNGSSKTFKCIKYTEVDEDGDNYETVQFFLDGDRSLESPYIGLEINGVLPEDGAKFKAGENKVRFFYGDDESRVFTEAYTVVADMAPAAIEFVPASGVTLWAFEGEKMIDGNAYWAEGNKFIVTYSDNKTKKTFIAKEVEYEENGRTGYFVGYFEDGNVTKDANGDFATKDFEIDLPEKGFALGKNTIRFGVYSPEGVRWISEPYTVIGKPHAEMVVFNPKTINATIYPEYDYIDWYNPANKVEVTFGDGSKKTFVPTKMDGPEGGYYYQFKCGDEELYWEYDDGARLKEGSNTLKVRFHGLRPYDENDDDSITFAVTINATKIGVCSKHSLVKIPAKKATCQEPGVKAHYECTACQKLFTDKNGKKETTINKLLTKKAKHVYKKKIISDEYLKSAATCTKKATYYYACKTCDEKGKKTFTSGKALGHDFVPGSITKATAKKDGKIASKCSRCNKTNKGVKIPKASKIVVLNKKSLVYVGGGAEKDAINVVVKGSKYPLGADEYTVTKSEPKYNPKKRNGTGTITVTFTPECKYYSGSMTLTYKITKVPKVVN